MFVCVVEIGVAWYLLENFMQDTAQWLWGILLAVITFIVGCVVIVLAVVTIIAYLINLIKKGSPVKLAVLIPATILSVGIIAFTVYALLQF